MSLPSFSPTLAVLFFWGGLFFLLGLSVSWRAAQRKFRGAQRQRVALELVLAHRRRCLADLLGRDIAVAGAFRTVEEAPDDATRQSAERAIDDRIQFFANGGEQATTALVALAGSLTRSNNLRAELADWTRQVADAAARYNEAALAVNSARRLFPANLLLRAQEAEDLPLYDS